MKKYEISITHTGKKRLVEEALAHGYCPYFCPYYELNYDAQDSCDFKYESCPIIQQDRWKCEVLPVEEKYKDIYSRYRISKTIELRDDFIKEVTTHQYCPDDCPFNNGPGHMSHDHDCMFRLTCPFRKEKGWECKQIESSEI